MVSELCTNAVQAAPRDDVHLEAARLQDGVRIAVTNRGHPDDIPPAHVWSCPQPLDARGRGLTIVDALSSSLSITRRRPGTVTVVALLPILGSS